MVFAMVAQWGLKKKVLSTGPEPISSQVRKKVVKLHSGQVHLAMTRQEIVFKRDWIESLKCFLWILHFIKLSLR